MSVIVKDMEMPDTCEECRISIEVGSDIHCQLFTGDGHRDFGRKAECGFESRPNWCPLRPLSEKHGDLIDRDAMLFSVLVLGLEGERAIETAPTIVEAEGD